MIRSYWTVFISRSTASAGPRRPCRAGLRPQVSISGLDRNQGHYSTKTTSFQGISEASSVHSNRSAVVVYNGTAYAYVKNLQGDIIAILDQNGNAVVQYAYDAWGKPISTTGSMASTLGEINPFRYRGYVYDQETGLYYLRSRYYSTVFVRFINADVLYTAYRSQYQYCKNNPVKNSDLNGFSHSDATAKPWYAGLQNRDGSYSLYDNDRFRDDNAFHEQLLVVNFNPADFDMMDGDLTLVDADFDFITGGWETDYVDVSLLDFGHVEASFGIDIDEGKFSYGAMASVWSPSISFSLFGCDITLGLEILSVGMRREVDLNTTSASYAQGYGLWGWSIEVDW